MNNIVKQLLLPASSAYRQHGVKTAAPVALVWLTSLAVVAQGVSSMSELTAGLGLALWMASQALGLLTAGSKERQSVSGDAYSENPLTAVRAALGEARSAVSYRRYDLKAKATVFLQGLEAPLPCCAVAY